MNPNPLVKENNERIKQENINRVKKNRKHARDFIKKYSLLTRDEKLAMEDMGIQIKIKEVKK